MTTPTKRAVPRFQDDSHSRHSADSAATGWSMQGRQAGRSRSKEVTRAHSEHSLNLNATDADASAAATGALPCIGAHQRRT